MKIKKENSKEYYLVFGQHETGLCGIVYIDREYHNNVVKVIIRDKKKETNYYSIYY